MEAELQADEQGEQTLSAAQLMSLLWGEKKEKTNTPCNRFQPLWQKFDLIELSKMTTGH